MLRVTADTNVIISALNFSGNPARILDMAEEGSIRLVVSDDILDEVERVLRRPKCGWPQERIDDAIRQISGFTEHVQPTQRIDVVTEDPTDNRILECAIAGRSQYLVSGDKHLLKVGQFQGVRIITPAEFVEMMTQPERGR
ncbi:putative toxin-antitoxin system toxin component, PIN family [Tunturiibacter psychrotolerans]|uniref:putative toxin-antitoxin system toxin component, PIN family n=1 Tax=Tunturiibacter psychrotolerans TaxID=3069686 RepID=UPI003D1D5840